MMNRTFSWESNVLQLMESYYITSANVEDLQTPDDYLHRCNVYNSTASYLFIASCNKALTSNLLR